MWAIPSSRTVDSSPTCPNGYQMVSYTWMGDPPNATSDRTLMVYVDGSSTTRVDAPEPRLLPSGLPLWDLMPGGPGPLPSMRGRPPVDSRRSIWACRPRHGLAGR